MYEKLNQISINLKRIGVIFFLLSSFYLSKAQVDTAFWFAVPDISEIHADRPVAFRFSTFDEPAIIRITLPAQNDLVIAELSIPSSSQESFVISDPDFLETIHSNIQNKGVLITSSVPITAYYEITPSINPDIYTLKGRFALGTEFVLPFQRTFPNQSSLEAFHSFQVVATEDNTTITVRPTQDIDTFEGEDLIEIILDRGQTFSFRAESLFLSDRLTGTTISSDKKIAVSITDDSILQGNNWDLGGDQLIPRESAGLRYILLPGFSVISAFEETRIVVDGEETILDANNQFTTTLSTSASILTSDNPVVIQYFFGTRTNVGAELAGAILPPLNCSGSLDVAFTRSSGVPFFLHIVFRKSSIDDFFLDGEALDISQFNIIDIDDNLAFVRVDVDVSINEGHRLVNTTGNFHLAISNGDIFGNRLGYFSNFENELIDTIFFCDETRVEEEITNAFSLFGEFEIDTLEQRIDTTLLEVIVTDEYCVFVDTSLIIQSELPNLTLPDTFLLCEGEDSILSFQEDRVIFNGVLEQDIFSLVGDSVQVFLENEAGCFIEQEARIVIQDSLIFNIPVDTFFCEGEEVSLLLVGNQDQLLVNDILFDSDTLIVNSPGEIRINISNNCSSIIDTIEIIEAFNPVFDLGEDRELCLTSNLISLPEEFTYLWNDGNRSADRMILTSGLFFVEAINDSGCVSRDSVNLVFKNTEEIPQIADQRICPLEPLVVSLPSGHDVYNWSDGIDLPNRELFAGTFNLIVETFVNDTLCFRDEQDFTLTTWEIAAPNVMTPNNDGKNDVFLVEGLDIQSPLKLEVFNRLGKRVYRNDNYQNEFDAEGLSYGTYFYTLEIPDFSSCTTMKGWLLILE